MALYRENTDPLITPFEHQAMNPVLSEIMKTGRTRTADGHDSVELHSAIFESEGRYLQKLVRQVDPEFSLEVGLAYGVSALFICEAINRREGTRHIVIDPNQHGASRDQGWDGIGMANLKRAGYGDFVSLMEAPSHQVLPELEAAGQRIDFAFIDGWHTFDFTLVDFFYIDRMLKPGGVVAFDNADWSSVRKVCRFIAQNLSYTVLPPELEWEPPRKRRILDHVLARVPVGKLPFSGRILHPALAAPDIRLGLWGPCIAFRKDGHDSRRWDHFQDF